MRTPLALFRGFQVASGVELDLPPLKEAVLRAYFQQQRLSQLHQVQAIVHAALDTDRKKIQQLLRAVASALFPELAASEEDFRRRAEKQMRKWREKVIEIDPVGDATLKDAADAEDALVAFQRRMAAGPANRRRRSR